MSRRRVFIRTPAQRRWALALFDRRASAAGLMYPRPSVDIEPTSWREARRSLGLKPDRKGSPPPCRLQAAAERAFTARPPFQRAAAWFLELKERGVIRPLVLRCHVSLEPDRKGAPQIVGTVVHEPHGVTEHHDEDGEIHPVLEDAPLFVAGRNWEKFVAEATRVLDLT